MAAERLFMGMKPTPVGRLSTVLAKPALAIAADQTASQHPHSASPFAKLYPDWQLLDKLPPLPVAYGIQSRLLHCANSFIMPKGTI